MYKICLEKMEEKKMKKGKKKGFRRILNWAGNVLAVTALAHGATQLGFWANDLYHAAFPSKQRAAFKEEFGFPLRGWNADLTREYNKVSNISETVAEEMHSLPFDLASIRIRSDNYLKMPFIDQLGQIITRGNSGYYGLNRIVLDEGSSYATTHHEIKHAKTFEIARKHPEFLDRWRALSLDENGESLYLNLVEQGCSRFRGLGKFVDEEKLDYKNNEALGFVSNYARTNVYEDIAEVGEEAEMGYSNLVDWLAPDDSERNEKLAAKFTLAEEYGIIPKGFMEKVLLDKAIRGIWGRHGMHHSARARKYLDSSEAFLEKYPDSVYECEVRANRSNILVDFAYSFDPKDRNDDRAELAREEIVRTLTADFKDILGYVGALGHGEEFYRSSLRDNETAQLFIDAKMEFWKRFREGDPTLSSTGVNDFLAERGYDLGGGDDR